MRHYGKEGPQCRPTLDSSKGTAQTCRLIARNLLFGRVPKGFVMGLGLGLILVVLVFGVAAITAVGPDVDEDFHRDGNSAIIIQR